MSDSSEQRPPPIVLVGDSSPPPSAHSVGRGFFDRRIVGLLLERGIAIEEGREFADVLAGCRLEGGWPDEILEVATELMRLVTTPPNSGDSETDAEPL